MSITRRLFLGHTAAAGVGLANGGQPYQSTGFDTDPVERAPTLAEKVSRLRLELIEASKELYPEVDHWHIITPDSEDCEDSAIQAGMFMIVGHRKPMTGGQRNG